MQDRITICGLRAPTRIGVPDEERGAWQSVALDVVMHPKQGFAGIEDDIGDTIDYYAVSLRLREIAAERPRKLIETLANDLAQALLDGWPLARVELTVRKFVLADTESVAVTITREASG